MCYKFLWWDLVMRKCAVLGGRFGGLWFAHYLTGDIGLPVILITHTSDCEPRRNGMPQKP